MQIVKAKSTFARNWAKNMYNGLDLEAYRKVTSVFRVLVSMGATVLIDFEKATHRF